MIDHSKNLRTIAALSDREGFRVRAATLRDAAAAFDAAAATASAPAVEVETVLCAAIHFDDGVRHVHQPVATGFVVAGHRHHNCYATVAALGGAVLRLEKSDGFITSRGRYVGRVEGRAIALAAGQIDDSVGSELYSEDLYRGGAWFEPDGTP